MKAQNPFDGFAIVEVPIDPALAATMQSVKGFSAPPRCWRVYACLNRDFVELQAISGLESFGVSYPWIVDCPTCPDPIKFYQHEEPAASGGSVLSEFLGQNVLTGLFATFPALQYDSWFDIGDPYTNAPAVSFVGPTGAGDPRTLFEAGGAFIDPGSSIGSTIFQANNPANTDFMIDSEYRVLIAQLTTPGVFEGIMTLQFREVQPDLLPGPTPPVWTLYDQTFTNFPGSFDQVCPQVFLPVELLEFNAAASDDRVNLMWVTASERNSERFFVERSMDQQTWKDVGSLPAAGNADEENDYFLVDHHPEPGVNYYRLRQVDTNGDTHYSDIRAAVFKQEQFTFYPNPTSDRVWFKGNLEDVERIRIIDMHGQVVLEQRTSGSPIREMDVHSLATGSYVIEVIYPNGQIYRNVMQVGR